MRNLKSVLFLLMAGTWLHMACSKEQSTESGNIVVNNNNTIPGGMGSDPATEKCKISRIQMMDNGVAQESDSVKLDASLNALGYYYQSASGNVDELAFNIANGKIITDAITGNYLMTDTKGRVVKCVEPVAGLNANDEYNYSYNAQGYLIGRTYRTAGINADVAKTTYTWTDGNLTKIVGKLANDSVDYEIEVEYDAARRVKSFLNIMPENEELESVILAVNLGIKPNNAVKKITRKAYQGTGSTPISTSITEFKNYNLDIDGKVTDVDVFQSNSGLFATIGGGNALSKFLGKMKISYKCK
jgi:YD repeat-containing protein